MMARGQVQRSSTLIDPASLQTRPTPKHMNSLGSPSSQQALGRRNSANIKPLLTFDDDKQIVRASMLPDVRMQQSRSVFGVDTIWEREMVKLREIEAQEKLDAEERRKREAEAEESKKQSKRKGKGKRKVDGKQGPQHTTELVPEPRVSAEPPVLPAIQKAMVRGPPPPGDDDESESDSSVAEGPSRPSARDGPDDGADHWYAGSSDDEDNGPRRTTGTGPRYPTRPADEDSEEDIPLAATVGRALQRATQLGPSKDDSDEEKPLSVLLQETKLRLPSIDFDKRSDSDAKVIGDDEDDVPLGLRTSKVLSSSQAMNSTSGMADDDDRPLALHPEQQRRTQYQMMAQQQQMMMQTQMHNSMFFGATPSMMGSGFFGPSIPPPMMMHPPMPMPMPMPSPPPIQDVAKYGRVDRWRRDVAVEGEP